MNIETVFYLGVINGTLATYIGLMVGAIYKLLVRMMNNE